MTNINELVSVIMPCYNAKAYLSHSLPALKASDYKNLEIIVVDDCSTDGSFEEAAKYADKALKMESRQAPAKVRNFAANISRGSILFFIDADVRIVSDTISKAVKLMLDDGKVDAVFGSYDNKPFEPNFLSQYRNLLHHFVHQNSKAQASTFWAGCGAIRREAFFESGGFPETYYDACIEDVELGHRLVEKGKRIILLKELQVTHLKKYRFLPLLRADILYRAIPWSKFAQKKGLPRDLNFKFSDRASGVASIILILSLILVLFWEWAFILLALSIGVLLSCNRRLYAFFLEKRGFRFTILAILLHWLYLFYSSVIFAFFLFSAPLVQTEKQKISLKSASNTILEKE